MTSVNGPAIGGDAKSSEDELEGDVGMFGRLKFAIFGVSYLLAQSIDDISARASIVEAVVMLAQMLSFPLNPMFWSDNPTITPIAMALSFISGNRLDVVMGPLGYRVLLGLLSFWAVSFVGIVCIIAWKAAQKLPQNDLLLRVMAVMAPLSSTYLFLPMCNVLFRAFACGEVGANLWMGTAAECHGAEHVVVGAAVLVLILVAVPLSCFFAATFLDRNPASGSWAARVHGRTDVLMLGIKVLLAITFNSLADFYRFGTIAVSVLLMLCGLAWVYLYTSNMPMVHVSMNALAIGAASVFTWCSTALLLTETTEAADTTPMVLFGSPIVFALGFMWTLRSERQLLHKPLESLSNMGSIDVWARGQLRKYLYLRSRSGLTDQQQFDSGLPLLLEAESIRDHWSNQKQQQDLRGRTKRSGSRARPSSGFADGDDEADVQLNLFTSDPKYSANSYVLPPALKAWNALMRAEKAYQRLGQMFSDRHLALLIVSGFQKVFSPFVYAELVTLSRSRRLHPPPDIEFWIYRRTRDLCHSGDSGSGSQQSMSNTNGNNVIDRVMFEHQAKQALLLRQESYRCMVTIWETLADTTPDLAAVQGAGVKLHKSLDQIDSLYRRMIATNPESATAMRGYASFLAEQRNESARAFDLLNRAGRIEDLHSRTRAKTMRHLIFGAVSKIEFDSSDERAASITISCEATNMGEVLTISQAACRLLNYSATQLVGQNIATIVPPPLRADHTKFLYRFASKSRSNLINKSRLLFAMDSGESLVPVWMQVREAPPAARTSAPRFSAVFQPVLTTENHIFFTGADTNFRICAATAPAMVMLGIEPGSLEEDESNTMLRYFPSLDPAFPQHARVIIYNSASDEAMEAMEEQALGIGGGDESARLVRFDGDAGAGMLPAGPQQAVWQTSVSGGVFRQLQRLATHIQAMGARSHADGNIATEAAFRDMGMGSTSATVPIVRLDGEETAVVIPVQNAVDGTQVVVGSIQQISLQGQEFFMMRWQRLDRATESHAQRRTSTAALSSNTERRVSVHPVPDSGVNEHMQDVETTGVVGEADSVGATSSLRKAPIRTSLARGNAGRRASRASNGVAFVEPGGLSVTAASRESLQVRRSAPRKLLEAAGGSSSPAIDAGSTNVVRFSGSHAAADAPRPTAGMSNGPEGSVSSGRSANTTQNLSRALKKQTDLVEREVRVAWVVNLVAWLFVIVMAVISVVVSNQNLQGLQDINRGLILSGERLLRFATAIDVTDNLAMLSTNLHLETGETNTIPAFLTQLLVIEEQFQLAHEDLQAGGKRFGSIAYEDEKSRGVLMVELNPLGANETAALRTDPNSTELNQLALADTGSWSIPFYLTQEQAARLELLAGELPTPPASSLDTAAYTSTTMDDYVDNFHFFEPSTDQSVLRQQAKLMSRFPAVARAHMLPLSEMAQFMEALMHRIALLEPTDVNPGHPDVRNFEANNMLFRQAANFSMQLRFQQMTDRESTNLVILIAAGGGMFFLGVVGVSVAFGGLVMSIHRRTRQLLRLFLIVPASISRRLARSQRSLLDKMVLAAQDEEGLEEELTNALDDENEGHQRAAWVAMLDADMADDDHTPETGERTGLLRSQSQRQSQRRQGRRQRMRSARWRQDRDGDWIVQLRKHADTSRFVCQRTTILLAPSAVVLIWVCFLVWFLRDVDRRARMIGTRQMLIAQASSAIIQYTQDVTAVSTTAEHRSVIVEKAKDSGYYLEEAMHTILFGGPVVQPDVGSRTYLESLPAGTPAFIAATYDGCDGLEDEDGCRAALEGAIASGMYNGFNSVMAIAKNILSLAPRPEQDPGTCIITQPGLREQLGRLHGAVQPHMVASVNRISYLLEVELVDLASSAKTTILAAAMVVIGVVGFLILFVSVPAANSLATPLRSARALLILIPPTLVTMLPPLKSAIRDVASTTMTPRHVKFEPHSTKLSKASRSTRN